MARRKTAPYGSWASPITTGMVADDVIGLGRIALDGSDTYWAELRPGENGRSIVVRRRADGRVEDTTPPRFSVGTAVHEYGTRAYTVHDGVVYFSNDSDQRIYGHKPGEKPVPLTPLGEVRYGGRVVDEKRRRLLTVREDHAADADQAVNEIVAVDLDGEGEPAVLLSSHDFYLNLRLSPDGGQLAWLAWNHPNMPWDGTELWVSRVRRNGLLDVPILVAGGVDEAVMQPEWSPDGTLYFISDRSGWANLYRWRDGEVEPVLEMEAEFCKTHWWIGMSSYGFVSDTTLVCSYVQDGTWRLAKVFPDRHELERIDLPYTEMGRGDLQVSGERVVFEAGSPLHPDSLLELDLASGALSVLRVASQTEVDPSYVSVPEAIEFPTENGLTAHAFFYPPKNNDFAGPKRERPPLLVTCHGGPHDTATTELDLGIQYWTSRGIGVVDVNYGGSTGYGRDYRERLIGEWGVVDVNDCVNAARFLIERGEADAERVAISGGSAGGYTALAAMTFRDVFKAGASHFGVSDLEALLTDIHKFDTYSLVGLVGPYPLYRKRYAERSPINYVDELNCPVIFFQGLDDTIVPADQSELMFNALRDRGVPTAYVTFEGEKHGFTKAQNIKRTFDAELYFYSQIFGFELADEVDPVMIENWTGRKDRKRPRR